MKVLSLASKNPPESSAFISGSHLLVSWSFSLMVVVRVLHGSGDEVGKLSVLFFIVIFLSIQGLLSLH